MDICKNKSFSPFSLFFYLFVKNFNFQFNFKMKSPLHILIFQVSDKPLLIGDTIIKSDSIGDIKGQII